MRRKQADTLIGQQEDKTRLAQEDKPWNRTGQNEVTRKGQGWGAWLLESWVEGDGHDFAGMWVVGGADVMNLKFCLKNFPSTRHKAGQGCQWRIFYSAGNSKVHPQLGRMEYKKQESRRPTWLLSG